MYPAALDPPPCNTKRYNGYNTVDEPDVRFPAAVCLAFRQTPPGIQDRYVLWGWAWVPNFVILRRLIISRAEAPKARP